MKYVGWGWDSFARDEKGYIPREGSLSKLAEVY
jgi:hypothetical protein